MEILKQHLMTRGRELKLGHKWVLSLDNDPKHVKLIIKMMRDNKNKML